MPRAFSLGNPAPGHAPDVDRVFLGTVWGGGRTYGTTLKCSCGWPRSTGGDIKVTNEAPSKGGRSIANDAYKAHLADLDIGAAMLARRNHHPRPVLTMPNGRVYVRIIDWVDPRSNDENGHRFDGDYIVTVAADGVTLDIAGPYEDIAMGRDGYYSPSERAWSAREREHETTHR